MSYCKSCGGEIGWMRTEEGRYIPVDPESVFVIEGEGRDTFIDEEGNELAGRAAGPGGDTDQGAENQYAAGACAALSDVREGKVKAMQTTETAETVQQVESGQAGRWTGLRKRLERLNVWVVAWYVFLTLAGVALYKVGAAYALRERGYYAVGGEALALLLPVVYYAAAAAIRDIARDIKGRR